MYHGDLDNHNYFGYLKGANEVNCQQAVLLCLLRALYYTGICSYAACTYYAQNYAGINHSICGLALFPGHAGTLHVTWEQGYVWMWHCCEHAWHCTILNVMETPKAIYGNS